MKYLLVLIIVGWVLVGQLGFSVQAKSFEYPKENEISINAYELFYPVVAGTLPTDKKYILKVIRDEIKLFFLTSSLEKMKLHTVISDKRLLEAEQMMLTGRNDLAIKCLDKSRLHLNKVIKASENIRNENEVISVSLTLSSCSERQQKYLQYLLQGKTSPLLEKIKENYDLAVKAEKYSDEILYQFLHGND